MSFKLPTAKVKEIKSKCKQALQEKVLSICQLAHIIGVLSSTHLAILPAPLHYQGLQMQKNQRSSPPPLIQINDSIGGAECYGFELVDQQFGDHQWETNSLRSSRDDDRIRCIQYRLGSLLEEPEDGRSSVIPGISTSYQCEGVACCFSSPTDFHGE